MQQQCLRLELQVDVNLCGVESHTHSAQDDVKCSLKENKTHLSHLKYNNEVAV